MKCRLAVLALLVSASVPLQAQTSAEGDAMVSVPVTVPDLHAPVPLSDALIRKAVRATIAEDPRPSPSASLAYGGMSSTAHERMTTAFQQAKVPDCLHEDALKLQPARLGPFNVVGPFSLPWVVSAMLRGKCQ